MVQGGADSPENSNEIVVVSTSGSVGGELKDDVIGIDPKALVLNASYDRISIRKLFSPSATGSLGGPWQSGIVQTPKGSGDYVLLVTLDGGRYDDVLYEDGYLRWKSQDQQRLDMPAIQRFIAHDADRNNIRLFIRSSKQREYAYLGLLEYVEHDLKQQNPCEFVWRVMRWSLTAADLTRMGLPFEPPLMPVAVHAALPSTDAELVKSSPPKLQAPKGVRTQAVLSDTQGADEIDWALRDKRNRELGEYGEALVIRHEKDRLAKAGRQDLADRVEHVALVDSRAGYDIRSFEVDGTEIFIEVKTTAGPKTSAFFISANELRASIRHGDAFRLYRIFGAGQDPERVGFYVLKGDVTNVLELTPTTYRARPT